MLHRVTSRGTMVMAQPAHAWVSGQMAGAWADAFEPRPEVLLAAEQHDIGWTDWEQQPTFNAKTGLPHAFLEMETADHLSIWTDAALRVEPLSTLAALLVSRHGTGLYERFHTLAQVQGEPEVLAYLESEKATQEWLLDRLRSGVGWGSTVDDDSIERASRLIAAWDWLSLIVLMNESERGEVKDVPWGIGRIDLQVQREDAVRWTVSPWPFVGDELSVVAEGRVLRERAGSEIEMQAMLAAAELVRVEVVLVSD